MNQGSSVVSIQGRSRLRHRRRVGRLCLPLLVWLALCVLTGCKKKQNAGGPPPNPPAPVTVAEAKRQPVAETLSVVGTLTANESIEVKPETDGTVAEILFQEGQPVKKGELLIRLDESKLAAALAEAEANLKLSAATFERNKELYREKLVSQQEYDQAAALFQANQATVDLRKQQLQDVRIVAPFAGVTGSRAVSPGQMVAKGATLTWLVDMATMKAEFNVPERSLSGIQVGQSIALKVAGYPRETFQGQVYFLAPQVDPNTRTLLIKARLPNTEHKLKPGMFANLALTLTLREDAIVIPESALMTVGERTLVYVITSDDTAQMRPVTVGVRMPNLVEITQGLQAGERVVAEGVQKVRPGGPVKAAEPSAVPRGVTNQASVR
jgi:membrane fusion protein, multidrug efflux system